MPSVGWGRQPPREDAQRSAKNRLGHPAPGRERIFGPAPRRLRAFTGMPECAHSCVLCYSRGLVAATQQQPEPQTHLPSKPHSNWASATLRPQAVGATESGESLMNTRRAACTKTNGNRSSNPRSCCCSKGDGGCQQAAHPSEAADKRVKTHAYRAPLETESTGHKITAFNHYHGGNACNGVFPPMRMPSVPPVPTRRAHLGARPPAGGHTTIAAPVFQRLLSLGANSRRMWKNSWMISTYRLMQAGM